ncbi:hypothetical protein [Nocardioides luteus]|uniref:Uncharacterized protein n=1 Tax=Nocardioides luteus TaxID=1844 RepID=A0A1J4MXM4_9ACTN|nr:hypothetical protein [Nocardioides luteus]OIJ24094.1 hypothetical protein UG56_024490 [Nocardioides luteus]
MSDTTPEPGEIVDLSLGLSDAEAKAMIDAPEIDIDEAVTDINTFDEDTEDGEAAETAGTDAMIPAEDLPEDLIYE